MNYEVIWTTSAENELANLWLQSSAKSDLNFASNAIDQLLMNDPNQIGSSSFDTVRICLFPPLGVEYEVLDDDNRVVVLSVWSTETGPPDPVGH